MDAANQASTLLSYLETYNFIDISVLFSDFLRPFSALTSTIPQNPNKKSSRSKKPSQSAASPSIRSLAKTFLPFVNRCLSIIPKRLTESPKHPKTAEFVSQLLECYKLCLACLDVISSELSGKPYCVHLQITRYVHCLMRWERYSDAIEEGFRVLKDLGGAKLEGKGWKVSMGELVPQLIVDSDGNVGVEGDVVQLVVDLVVVIAQCVSLSKVKDAGKYSGLLVLLDEVRPWFRHLETFTCNKLQRMLLGHMKNAALFLIREVTHFEGDLVPGFCAAVFEEYTHLLTSLCIQGKTMEELEEFVKFVSNCTSKCRSVCKNIRVSIAMHMYRSADNFSQDFVHFYLIQRLHALGLYFFDFCLEPNISLSSECSTSTHSVRFLPNGWDKLQDLSVLLSYGKKFYSSNLDVCDKPINHAFKDFFEKGSISSNSDCKVSKSCKSTNGEAYLSFYMNALKFLCWPLADFVTSERKRIVSEDMDSALGSALKLILEAFLEYSYLFPHCQQASESCVEIDMVVLSISVACFTLSLKLNFSSKGSTSLVNYILSDECIILLRPQMLKYIIAMLHNNFVEFYRHERLKEAYEALELCCKASWNRCLLLCEILVGKQKGFDGEIPETMIVQSVNDACKFNSLLMDIGHHIDNYKLENAVECGLVKWCLARNLCEQLPCPVTLIKHWIKIQCKLYKNTEGNAPILGNYLLCFSSMGKSNISTEIIGIILEQELAVYQDLCSVYPTFCQRMQREVIDILLQKVYLSSNCISRSIILLKKGMLSRTFGIEGLDNCICCLSEAIESVNGFYGMTNDIAAKVYNHLAVVHGLRALSTHEADPTSKEIFEDIRKAVNLWLRIDVPFCSYSGNCDVGCEYVLVLLYHIADLLSIKGEMSLHSDVLNVIIKAFKQMNAPLGKCLLSLWESRRVNHALCVVPVNEAFIMALSEHYGKEAVSLDFWISSLKDSKPLLAGLQQNFAFLSSLFPLAFHECKHFSQSEISVGEVKEIASNLITNDSVSHHSAFLAGYLYYDLSERLFAGGKTIEALFCAKEAHRLRGKLIQEHFYFSFQQNEDSHEELGESLRIRSSYVSQFSVLNKAAIRAWPTNATSPVLGSFSLTPWNVLRCYLESMLQVGIIHERLGNVSEAKAQFLLGKNISSLQSLPRFAVSFSSCLGKVYHGMNLLDLAHNELLTSEQDLAVERNSLTCSRCLLMLESSISEQLGNLYSEGINCATENPYESSIKNLISFEKGDLAVWFEEAIATHSVHEYAAATSGINNIPRPSSMKAKTEPKRSRKTKKELASLARGDSCTAEENSRVTRSRKMSSHGNKAAIIEGAKNITVSHSDGQLETEAAIIFNRIICQKCFLNELNYFGSLASLMLMKWEFVRRRQLLRLLIGLGKCQGASAGTHRLHSIYSKCLSILLGGNDCHCSGSTLLKFDSICMETPGDVLVGERAEVLYNLCLLLLKSLYSEDFRTTCCDLDCFQMSHVVPLLKLSFVLSREVPLLFQKVSKLLALVYVVSASRKNSAFLISCKVLSENYWAAYFHQASVGIHHNLQLLSSVLVKHRSQMVSKNKASEAADATSMLADTCTLLKWAAPESTKEIESCAAKFFENLPSTTVLCVSLLGDSYAGLLEKLMDCPSGVYGWIMLSHLNTESQPAVIVLPLSTVLQDEKTSTSCSVFGDKNVQKEWRSPWGPNALVDNVAPLFKLILRGNYLSCSSFPEEDTERSRKLWWTSRENLDKCLHKLLRDMEETWFGQWKYLLLGRWLDTDPLNCAMKEFMHKTKKDGCKLDLNESILKVVMGGIRNIDAEKVRIPKMFLEKGCYIGSIVDSDQGRCNKLDKAYYDTDSVSDSLIAAVNKVELEYCNRREPVVLVLDNDIQMLPWENMPFMREQEVYRMPSVMSIFMALQQRSDSVGASRRGTKFPLIDPLDAFYLLNPSGDLSRTQSEFEEWFTYQNIQGKAGVIPSTEELCAALENRDLFLYFGHGSGDKYMPRDKIQKLESCAATLLMGCSSGTLNLNGRYAPVGTSLSYMLAGAPIVVANLWEVTDLDIDRFAKAVLKSFLEERSMPSSGCIQCSLLAEELQSMSVSEKKGNPKKGRGKKKAIDSLPDVSGEYCYRHKLRAGYFVSQARKACKLPFLIGAAPVCYGVPTGIRKKDR